MRRVAPHLLIRPIAAGAFAVVAACAGLWVSLLAGIYSGALQRPDPNPALDGDPCCGHPDTWSDVVIGGVYFVATLSVALGLLAAAATLGAFAVVGHPPRLARMRGVRQVAVFCGCCAVGVPLSWIVSSVFLV